MLSGDPIEEVAKLATPLASDAHVRSATYHPTDSASERDRGPELSTPERRRARSARLRCPHRPDPCRARGRPADDGERALAILVFRYFDDVRRRVAIKVPVADVEDVAMEAVISAIRSAFDGTAIGQFHAWLHRIVRRRIADYHRRAESRPAEAPLPEEHAETEGIWGEEATSPDDKGAVEVESMLDEVLGELSEVHRRVVELFVFADLPAREAAARVNAELGEALNPPMSVDNVNQIVSRFRKAIRARLEAA